MSTFLAIQIHGEKIEITSSDGILSSNDSSLIEIDENENVISIGNATERAEATSKTTLYNPFLLDDFRPKMAATMICYSVYTTIQNAAELSNKTTYAAVEWRVSIDGYEKLDKKTQDLFEFYIQDYSWAKAKILFINNQQIDINRFQWAIKVVKLGYLFTAFSLLFPIYLFFQGTTASTPATLWFIFGFIIILVAILYIAGLVYFAISKFVMKNLIPYPVYKAMIEDYSFGLPKQFVNFLRHNSSSINGGG